MSFQTDEVKLEENLKIHKRGTIVTLHSHPFTKFNQSVVFAGEPNLIPPLMVVVETMFDNKTLFDENTGLPISGNGIWQSRCIWFSHKTYQIEEAWISSKLLKEISATTFSEDETLGQLKAVGTLVTLKTMHLESGKLKISLSQKGNIKDEKNKITNALLSFVPPVMQVIGTVKSESKEPLFDSKTNQRRRFISQLLVKCKYYNISSDKMSEVVIPIEALILIPKIDPNLLTNIQSIIGNPRNLVLVNNSSDDSSEVNVVKTSIYQLKRITNKFGKYFIEYYDYFKNTVDEMEIHGNKIFKVIAPPTSELPKFILTGNELAVTSISKASIEELLLGADAKTIFLRIIYRDQFGNETTRVINDWSFVSQKSVIDGEESTVSHLKAFCFLRNDIRFFSVNGISKIEVIDISKTPIDAVSRAELLVDIPQQ